MANSTTVHFQRKTTPLMGFLATTVVLLILSPLVLNRTAILGPQKKTGIMEKAVAQPVYQEIARASTLLTNHQADEAARVLDGIRMEPLLISAGGYAEGVMADNSPTTLLIQLSRLIRKEAETQANTDEAIGWVARLHQLSDQALRSPMPTLDGVQSAYFLKTSAFKAEEQVWKRVGNARRAQLVARRYRLYEHKYATLILPEIARNRSNIVVARQTDAEVAGRESRETDRARQIIRGLL